MKSRTFVDCVFLHFALAAPFAVALAPGPASAQRLPGDPPIESRWEADFRSAALEAPSLLLAQGVRGVGDFDVLDFIERSRSIDVGLAENLAYRQRDGSVRRFARWEITGERLPRIWLNSLMWQAAPWKARALGALHEFLSALDFVDVNYVATTTLALLADAEIRDGLLPTERAQLESYVQKRARVAGGSVVGVGGGGDWFGPLLKLEAARGSALRLIRSVTPQERRRAMDVLDLILLGMNVEVSWGRHGRILP